MEAGIVALTISLCIGITGRALGIYPFASPNQKVEYDEPTSTEEAAEAEDYGHGRCRGCEMPQPQEESRRPGAAVQAELEQSARRDDDDPFLTFFI